MNAFGLGAGGPRERLRGEGWEGSGRQTGMSPLLSEALRDQMIGRRSRDELGLIVCLG